MPFNVQDLHRLLTTVNLYTTGAMEHSNNMTRGVLQAALYQLGINS